MQAARLAAKARQRGYRWLALETDDFGNTAHWPWFESACRDEGIMPGTWVTQGGNLGRWEPTSSDFMVAEDEGASDRSGILAAVARGLPSKPKAIIGSGWSSPTSRDDMRPVVDAGFHFLTECYARTDDGQPTGYTPEGLADNAHRLLGFPLDRIQPAFGYFGGAGDLDYQQWRAVYLGCADWLVDNVLVNA